MEDITDKSKGNLKKLQAIIQNYQMILPVDSAPAPVTASIKAAMKPSAQPSAPTQPAPRQHRLSFAMAEISSQPTTTPSDSFSSVQQTPATSLPSPTRPIRRLSFGGGGVLPQRSRLHVASPTQQLPPPSHHLTTTQPVHQSPTFSSRGDYGADVDVMMSAPDTPPAFIPPQSPSTAGLTTSLTPLKKRTPIKSIGMFDVTSDHLIQHKFNSHPQLHSTKAARAVRFPWPIGSQSLLLSRSGRIGAKR